MSEQVSVTVASPMNCTDADIAAFARKVLAGGEVNTGSLPGLLQRALALAFAYCDGVLAGVGALKRPNSTYRAKVFVQAKSERNPTDFEFELGWVYVDPSMRGKRLASRIVEALMPSVGSSPLYASSRVNNERMHASLRRAGFTTEGTPYPSKMNEPPIQLFVRVTKGSSVR